jgi:hypothetical protein
LGTIAVEYGRKRAISAGVKARRTNKMRFHGELSFAKTLQAHEISSRNNVTGRPHAIHFKPVLDVGEGQATDIHFLPTKIAFGIEA